MISFYQDRLATNVGKALTKEAYALCADSYPQTPPGYYSCQTLAHINSWRQTLQAPLLPL